MIGFTAMGCSGIRVVKESKQGGEITLLGMREEALEKARVEMARNCGGADSYEILEQGEAVVGSVITSASKETKKGNEQTTTSTAETGDKTEWRLKYACKAAAPAPAEPAGAGPSEAPPQPAPSHAESGSPQGRIVREVVIRF